MSDDPSQSAPSATRDAGPGVMPEPAGGERREWAATWCTYMLAKSLRGRIVAGADADAE